MTPHINGLKSNIHIWTIILSLKFSVPPILRETMLTLAHLQFCGKPCWQFHYLMFYLRSCRSERKILCFTSLTKPILTCRSMKLCYIYFTLRLYLIWMNQYYVYSEISECFCCALYYCGYISHHYGLMWYIHPYYSGLVFGHWGDRTSAPVSEM